MTNFQALPLAKPETSFTSLQRHHIGNVAKALTKRLGTPVQAFFGDTETGEQWADISVAELPMGSSELPGQLVSIAAGGGTGGGHIVMNRRHETVGPQAGTLDYERLTRRVRKEAIKAYQEMCAGSEFFA